jgi:hypothetical protein
MASSTITMTACYSISPDPFNPSPSWGGYVTNAITGIEDGCTSQGSSNSPTYYSANGVATGGSTGTTSATVGQFGQNQVIDSAGASFDSGGNTWNGNASPTGAFAGEFGNQIADGLLVTDGNQVGGTFSLSQLNWSLSSSDAANSFGFVGSFAATDDYSSSAVGIVCTSANCATYTTVTSGAATQLVDELAFVGVGGSFCADSDFCPGTTIAQQENYILTNVDPFTVANTYSLDDANGNAIASVSNTAVISPEPQAWFLAALGFLLLAMAVRYRRRKANV